MNKKIVLVLGAIISHTAFADLVSDFNKESERLNKHVFSEDVETQKESTREEFKKKNPTFGDVRYLYELKTQKLLNQKNTSAPDVNTVKKTESINTKTESVMPIVESIPIVPNTAPIQPKATLRVIGNNTEKAEVTKDGTIKLPNGTLITPRNTTANLLNNPNFLNQ